MSTAFPRLMPIDTPVAGVTYELADSLGVRNGNLVQGVVGGTTAPIVTANNINTILQEAGGAGWEKVQITAAGYLLKPSTSGASRDFHIEPGGDLGVLAVADWPIPNSPKVDVFKIRNFSGGNVVFAIGVGYSGIVTADGDAATPVATSYSIRNDGMIVVSIDSDGWVQVVPSAEVTQAEYDALNTLVLNHGLSTGNPHNTTKAQVGLGNADNTSDANKPVSTAQQTALDGKLNSGATIAMAPGYPTTTVARLFTATGRSVNIEQISEASFSNVILNGGAISDGLTGQFVANTLNTSVAGQVTCYFGVIEGAWTKAILARFRNIGSNVEVHALSAKYWPGNVLNDAGWTTAGGIPAGSASSTIAPDNTVAGYGLETLTCAFKAVPVATPSVDGLMAAADKTKLAGIAAGATANTVNNTLTSTSTTEALSAAQGKVLQDEKQATLVSGTTIKTINGVALPGSGDIVITPTTVSSTVPTHNLDLVSDNYAGRALHLRTNGMTATTNLATWSDSSGNSRDMVQATASLQPDVVENVLNGLPVVRFDADDKMARASFDVTANHSIFAVVKTGATITGAPHIISEEYAPDNKLSFAMGIAQAGEGSVQGMFVFGMYDTGWFSAGGVVTPVANTNYILSGIRNQGVSISLFVNGNASGVNNTTGTRTAFNSAKKIYFAATWTNSDTWNGDIAEIVIFPTALSAAERQKVEGYLAHKYALLANLDAGHPYKVTAPQAGSLQVHASNSAATTAGLTIGTVYMSSDGLLRVVF